MTSRNGASDPSSVRAAASSAACGVLAPEGCLVVNALLHLVNSVLVWRLLLRLDVRAAWVAAAVFAVQPLRVESAAWIAGREILYPRHGRSG
ncbi:MAG: hypothetical protein OXE53_08310 [Deltaproteobacteria bacterium]|nr:hypothetical protein [Deltaproteobacteria bacterium]